MNVNDVALSLVLLAPLDWIVTGALIVSAHRVRESSLRERAEASLVVTIGATIAAAIGVAVLLDLVLPPGFGLLLLTLALYALSLPQLIWGVSLVRGRFR